MVAPRPSCNPTERAIEAGAVAHLLKPFHDNQLVATVTGALVDHVRSGPTAPDPDAEQERRYQLIMVETMLRAGYTEDEITAALSGQPVPSFQPVLVPLLRWLRAKLER